MLANGTHGVFFTCDVDEARASFQTLSPAQEERDGPAPLTTDDGSRLLTLTEIATLTAEVTALVASLPVPAQTIPLVPHAPWMCEDDARSDAEADAAWQSSSVTMLPSTRTLANAPHWIQDPDADVGLPFLRCYCYGRNATALLLADPGHRAVKRGTLISLVKFSDESYSVLRNENIT